MFSNSVKCIFIRRKIISVKNIKGPTGVRGRNSDNALIKEKLGWAPSQPLRTGVEETYNWIIAQIEKKQKLESKSLSVA